MENIHDEEQWDMMVSELRDHIDQKKKHSTPKRYIKMKYGKGHMKKLMEKKNPDTIYGLMTEYNTWKNKYDHVG
jgi:hypothetical protein